MENWLKKASTKATGQNWKHRWIKFADWIITEENLHTGKPYMGCVVDEVDDVIGHDFENMPRHQFQDKYQEILRMYADSLSDLKSNTVLALISTVRSFFKNEFISVKMQYRKDHHDEINANEHYLTQEELRRMWLIADMESKARLSTAVSLGWGIGDFLSLKTLHIRETLNYVDSDGFATFDCQSQNIRAKALGILTPNAVSDLISYLKKVPRNQENLWTTNTKEGFNYWLKKLAEEAGIKSKDIMRFHLIRKYVFNILSKQCGTYEAKLLIGKKILLANTSELQTIKEQLIDKYKRFAYPMLRLGGYEIEGRSEIERLEKKIELQSKRIKILENIVRNMYKALIGAINTP